MVLYCTIVPIRRSAVNLIYERENERVPCDLDLPFRSKVLEILISKDEHLPLCSKQSQLVEPRIVELRNLNTGNLCANVRADVVGLDVRTEKIGFRRISVSSWIDVLFIY